MPISETVGGAPVLSAEDFKRVRRIAYERAGLAIPIGKDGLVRSRVARRLRERGIGTFAEYLNTVEAEGGQEMVTLIDLLTTNKTDFFREIAHFDYLQRAILPAVSAQPRGLRVWSAGCSSGEEPYTLSMVLQESLPPRTKFRILATDISTQVVAKAKLGAYAADQIADVSRERQARWFTPTADGGAVVTPELRAPITFAHLNLMAEWPMSGPFDLILCRNVMIYFDKPTITTLVNRFYDLLAPGGHLFIGHSESLTAIAHRYRYVQPAVYQK
jgi:chemotaxis protein methyltransferase CheR